MEQHYNLWETKDACRLQVQLLTGLYQVVPEVFTAQFTQLFKLKCKGFNNFHGKQDNAHNSDFDLTFGVNASETTYPKAKKKLVPEQKTCLKSYQSHYTSERLFFSNRTQDYFVTSSEERLNLFYCFKLGVFTLCFAAGCFCCEGEVILTSEEEANCVVMKHLWFFSQLKQPTMTLTAM